MTHIKTALIGHPVSHSKSPLIHTYWMKQQGIDGSYEAIDIAPDNLKEGVRKLINDGYTGFNVTVPHKQAIFDLCDDVDDAARVIGAVNTVLVRDGKLQGTNTDAFGFMQNLQAAKNLPEFSKGSCVVLGAGGAARAIVYALGTIGFTEIIVTNRTFEKAKELCGIADDFMRPVEWEERNDALLTASLLVNTTSAGMSGKEKLDIDLSLLSSEAAVCDIVYAPLMTDLLQAAKERGNPYVTGIGMLLHQARGAFAVWHGVMPEVDKELEALVLA